MGRVASIRPSPTGFRRWTSSQDQVGRSSDRRHRKIREAAVLSTTDDVSALVAIIAEKLPATDQLARDLVHVAETFLAALMQPRVLRLRRLVIASADRLPEISTAWYEKGFERVLAALATSGGGVHEPLPSVTLKGRR
jgi:hypothetical protein